MTNTSVQKPSRLERARERLDKAVARVEAALETRARNGGDGVSKELEAVRAKNAALKESYRAVSERLEGTIDRLKTILES